MGFFDDLKEMFTKIWDVARPSIWEVFQYALSLVVVLASKIVGGYLNKEEAREEAVSKVVEKFSFSPEFSESKARLMVELAVAFYKVHGEASSKDFIKYDDPADYMAWYLSRPDKTKD